MKINYLIKNIFIGLALLIVIDLLIFKTLFLAKYSIFGWLLAMIPLALLIRLLFRRTNSFISGFTGEKDIEIELKSLGENFICINSGLDTGRGNIDKIILGSTGVWTLEVKNHSGYFTFDGDNLLINNSQKTNFLSQAYAEAKTLEDLIKLKLDIQIKVQPIVVFSNKFAKVRLGQKLYKGVYVIKKEWLNKLISETHIWSLDKETILRIQNIIITPDS